MVRRKQPRHHHDLGFARRKRVSKTRSFQRGLVSYLIRVLKLDIGSFMVAELELVVVAGIERRWSIVLSMRKTTFVFF